MVKKPTGFVTNSVCVQEALQQRCAGGHRHVHLMGGKAKLAQRYPKNVCRAILRGLRTQLTIDGVLKDSKSLMFLMMSTEENVMEMGTEGVDEWNQYYDDISGHWLNTTLVQAARAEEMKVFGEHQVYSKVPISECRANTGREPVGCKWLDVNKGDTKTPEYRSRLVAQEIKNDIREDLFAATPPLAAKQALFSLAVTSLARGRGSTGGGPMK